MFNLQSLFLLNNMTSVSNNNFNSLKQLEYYSSKNNDVLIFIYFTATWCGPCKKIKPFIQEKIDEYKNKNVLFKTIDVDDDEYSELCDDLSVSAMPTFIGFKNNNLVNKIVGGDETAINAMLITHS